MLEGCGILVVWGVVNVENINKKVYIRTTVDRKFE